MYIYLYQYIIVKFYEKYGQGIPGISFKNVTGETASIGIILFSMEAFRFVARNIV